MTLKGGRLELLNKIRSGVRTLAFFSVLFFAAPAAAIEITAIDFNGDLIGKVIPDGKVVSLDNQLIGNVTADSLIVNFDGELIGGVIPQGIAIGNDNKGRIYIDYYTRDDLDRLAAIVEFAERSDKQF